MHHTRPTPNTHRPQVSVALTTFNSERYLEQQLRSIARQTVPPAEIVIADDGSTDATPTVVSRFMAESSIPVIDAGTERLASVAATMTRALAHCSYPVIALSDHDDVWLDDRVERGLAALAQHPGAKAVFADAWIIDETGNRTGKRLFETLLMSRSEREHLERHEALSVLVRRNVATGATMLVTRELVDSALPVPTAWIHDEWFAAVAALGGHLAYDSEPVIEYRLHGANQIGAAPSSPWHRVARMLGSSAARFARLQPRSAVWWERARGLGASPEELALLQGKAAFETARRAYPATRVRRPAAIWRELRAGAYRRYASQGSTDAVRDLIQSRDDQ